MKKCLLFLVYFLFVSCSSLQRLSLRLRSHPGQTDFQKPAFCSISLNTKDELNVFKQHLRESFNFVELFNSENSDWFEKACHSGIKCDVLLISGHFGESFFGYSGHLSLKTLEDLSCRSSCNGILNHPKEVFLFGSNTVADKSPDLTTPDEYTDALFYDKSWRKSYSRETGEIRDIRELAEWTAAFRYSPLGFQVQDRMKRVFQSAKIYGFRSIAPKTSDVYSRLHRYFKRFSKKTVKYSKTKTFSMVVDNTLWSDVMGGLGIRFVDGLSAPDSSFCILGSDEPDYKKLSWVSGIFGNGNRVLTYAPDISEYLSLLEKRLGKDVNQWPEKEAFYFEKLQFSKSAKSVVSKFLSRPIRGILSAQLDVLRLGKKIGWYDRKEKRKLQAGLLRDTFLNNLKLDEMKLICSLNTRIDLNIKKLPGKKWNIYTIEAIGCVKPQSEEIHLRLITQNRHHVHELDAAIIALGKIKPQSERVQLKLISLLSKSGAKVRLSVVDALSRIKPQSEKVHLRLVDMLLDGNEDMQRSASYVLSKVQPRSQRILKKIKKRYPHKVDSGFRFK